MEILLIDVYFKKLQQLNLRLKRIIDLSKKGVDFRYELCGRGVNYTCMWWLL